jgi:hypothetical protein
VSRIGVKKTLTERLSDNISFWDRLSSSEKKELLRAAEYEQSSTKIKYLGRFGSIVMFPHVLVPIVFSSMLVYVVRKGKELGVNEKGQRLNLNKFAWLLGAYSVTQSKYCESGLFNRVDVMHVFGFSRLRHGIAFRYWIRMGFIENVSDKELKRWTYKLPKVNFNEKRYYRLTPEALKFIHYYHREFNKQLDHMLSFGDSFKDLMKYEHTKGYLYKILSWFNHDRDKFMSYFVDDDGDLTKPIDLRIKDMKKHAADWLLDSGKYSKERLNNKE